MLKTFCYSKIIRINVNERVCLQFKRVFFLGCSLLNHIIKHSIWKILGKCFKYFLRKEGLRKGVREGVRERMRRKEGRKGKPRVREVKRAGVEKKRKERFYINNLGILYQEQKYSPC